MSDKRAHGGAVPQGGWWPIGDRGGIDFILVGERGPELIDLPPGTTVRKAG